MNTFGEKSKIEIIKIEKEGTQALNFQKVILIIGVISFSPLIKLCWLVGNGWFSFIRLSSNLISELVKKLDIGNNARIVLGLLEMRSNIIVKDLLG